MAFIDKIFKRSHKKDGAEKDKIQSIDSPDPPITTDLKSSMEYGSSKTHCQNCGATILRSIFVANNGLCAPCAKGPDIATRRHHIKELQDAQQSQAIHGENSMSEKEHRIPLKQLHDIELYFVGGLFSESEQRAMVANGGELLNFYWKELFYFIHRFGPRIVVAASFASSSDEAIKRALANCADQKCTLVLQSKRVIWPPPVVARQPIEVLLFLYLIQDSGNPRPVVLAIHPDIQILADLG